jgi:hypothetical protein
LLIRFILFTYVENEIRYINSNGHTEHTR